VAQSARVEDLGLICRVRFSFGGFYRYCYVE